MFQEFAIQLAQQKGAFLALMGLGFALFGFLAAQVVLPNFARPVHRLGFMVWSSAFYLIGAFAYSIWASFEVGTEPVFMGFFVMGGFFLIIALGFGFGLCARGRSISICGRSTYAWVALVPGLNCVLAGYRPNALFIQDNSKKSYTSLVGVGAVVLMSGGATELLDLGFTGGFSYAQFGAQDEAIAAMEFAQYVERSNLGDVLWYVALDMPDNIEVDDGLVLVDTKSSETALQVYYQIVTDTPEVPDDVRIQVARRVCDDIMLYILLEAGAEIEQIFDRPDGSRLGSIKTYLKSCEPGATENNAQAAANNPGSSPQI